MNNKKEIIIGFIVGLIANTFGTLLYILLFSDLSVGETINAAISQGHIGSLLALGAVLNLVAFFAFLRIKRDQRAKGVMLATLVTALIILMYKVMG
ncbi:MULTISPECIES: hypothetical protein [Flavobacteriaceae]|jgi:uncharacterized membrane protein|uniref:Uncharacterized protein n=1 Tax=Flagellimonas marinaquae TaxID=254955 RepID=A0AA48H9H7_9FLAO|nr:MULTISPECIES: hypothetical protein [Allomuricauda]MCA0959061.1 hypothetical protein [Allomuricauda ruestringensis]USD26207.1 hypothetical protein MJO53_04780 [Allomuricauda aquimarina]BDW91972.1 hypothetical protein MACH07_08040 [Allomuricauda aquimarina]